MQPTVTCYMRHVTIVSCVTQSRQSGATKKLENNHWLSDPEQRRNLVCNYLRLLSTEDFTTVPGGDGVIGAKEDIVSMHGMEL